MLLLKMPFLSSIHNPACSRHCISIHHSITLTPGIPYDWSILTLDVNHVNRDFKIQRNDSNESVKEKKNKTKKAIGLMSKQQRCTCITHFCAFLCRFRVLWECQQATTKFFFLYVSGLGYGPLEFNFRNNCDKDWKNANSLFKRCSRCRYVVGQRKKKASA